MNESHAEGVHGRATPTGAGGARGVAVLKPAGPPPMTAGLSRVLTSRQPRSARAGKLPARLLRMVLLLVPESVVPMVEPEPVVPVALELVPVEVESVVPMVLDVPVVPVVVPVEPGTPMAPDVPLGLPVVPGVGLAPVVPVAGLLVVPPPVPAPVGPVGPPLALVPAVPVAPVEPEVPPVPD